MASRGCRMPSNPSQVKPRCPATTHVCLGWLAWCWAPELPAQDLLPLLDDQILGQQRLPLDLETVCVGVLCVAGRGRRDRG